MTLLLYKDARCDMQLLDETVGPLNWKREHTRDNANCIVSIYDESKKEWVSKEDVGTLSNTESTKGLASDSFKRACFNWGIGRELYTAPFIFVPCDTERTDRGYKLADRDRFIFNGWKVSEIEYIGRQIVKLELVDKNGVPGYSWKATEKLASETEKKQIRLLCKRLNVDVNEMLVEIGWTKGDLTEAQAAKCRIYLKEVEDALNTPK